jgi:flagellar hook assembly protein FlgD
VRVLLDEGSLSAGTHSVTWDGRNDAGDPVEAGVYLCRLDTDSGGQAWRVARLR